MSSKEVNYLKWLKDLHSRRILLPNQLDDTGLSQVHHCAYRGYLSCLKWLAKHGGSLASRYVGNNCSSFVMITASFVQQFCFVSPKYIHFKLYTKRKTKPENLPVLLVGKSSYEF
jgi:hypothetical protein